MSTTLVEIAKAVAGVLTTQATPPQGFALPVTVTFSFLPEYDPAQLKIPTLTVVPKTIESERAARAGMDRHYQVDIGIQCKLDYEPTQVEVLMALVAEIDTFLAATPLEGVGEITWVGSANNPIYAPEHLRKGVFTSVLTLTYRGVG